MADSPTTASSPTSADTNQRKPNYSHYDKLLKQAGVEEAMDYLMSLDKKSYVNYRDNSDFTDEQKKVIDKARNRGKRAEGRAKFATSTPKTPAAKPKIGQCKTKKATNPSPTEDDPDGMLSMSKSDFIAYKKKLPVDQQMLASSMRRKYKRRLRHKHQRLNKSISISPKKETSTNFVDDLDVKLRQLGVHKKAEKIMKMSTSDYVAFAESLGLTNKKRQALSHLRRKIGKRLNRKGLRFGHTEEHDKSQEDQEDQEDLSNELNVDDAQFLNANSTLAEPIDDNDNENSTDGSLGMLDGLLDLSQASDELIELDSSASILPEDHPELPTTDKICVQIEDLINGSKIFTKESTAYPGYSYIYRLRNPPPGFETEADSPEIYECNNCIEVASTYRSDEARKYVMNTLKTVQVRDGEIIEGDYDGHGHVCVPLELIRKKYNLE